MYKDQQNNYLFLSSNRWLPALGGWTCWRRKRKRITFFKFTFLISESLFTRKICKMAWIEKLSVLHLCLSVLKFTYNKYFKCCATLQAIECFVFTFLELTGNLKGTEFRKGYVRHNVKKHEVSSINQSCFPSWWQWNPTLLHYSEAARLLYSSKVEEFD